MGHTRIAPIQEPWIRDNKVCGFRDLNKRIFYKRTGKTPRAAVYVSAGLNAIFLNQFSDDDTAVVRISREEAEGGDFLVVSSYLPSDAVSPPPSKKLVEVVEYSREANVPMILSCDSNSHHKIWGSSDTNARGDSYAVHCGNRFDVTQ